MSKQRNGGLLISLFLSVLLLCTCGPTPMPEREPATAKVEGKVWQFPDEGVEVTVPPQERPVHVVKGILDPLEAMPAVPGGFQPFRGVINLDVRLDVQGDETSEPVQTFNPPIQIVVRYTADDLDRAAKFGKSLSLGFWDGTQWVAFTAEKHHFRLEPDATHPGTGVGIVEVSQWGDPSVAWGT